MSLVLDKQGVTTLAQEVASQIKGGEVFLLRGDLGSGKTFFVKQVAKNLGAAGVKSPSFVILEIHRTRKKFFLAHFDFYRLSEEDIKNFEWQDFIFNKKYVCFIEWGEKLKPFLKAKNAFEIMFKWLTAKDRKIILSPNLKKWLKK